MQESASSSVSETVVVGFMEITKGPPWYLPYGTGLLRTYAEAHAREPQRYRFLTAEFRRKPVKEAVEALAEAEIIGFSVYVWNVNYNLAVAKAVKAARPETLIVFGGPQVPDEPGAFLTGFPFIDVCVHGEGEAVFLQLLEAFPGREWEAIPGISYRQDGQVVTQARGPRMRDLDQIPSPFLSGVFDPLIAAHPDLRWDTIWETNRGCPFSCAFCDWGSAVAAKVTRFGPERLAQELQWFAANKINLIFSADANFGMLPRDLDLARQLAQVHKDTGYPKTVVVQMSKNKPERAFEAHHILWKAGLLISATLSLQSVTPETLTAIRRENISLDAYQQMLELFVKHGIPTHTDMLIGLPGDSFESFVNNISTLLEQGQHSAIRFWNVYLLPNAEMSAPAYRQKYGIEAVISPMHTAQDLMLGQMEEVPEYGEVVVATNTLPREDFLRVQAMAWMVQLLYYHRLLQLPLLMVQALSGLSHRRLILAFCEDPLPPGADVLGFVREFFRNQALEVSQGKSEFCQTEHPGGNKTLFWVKPPDFCMVQLTLYQQMGAFFKDCQATFEALLQRENVSLPPGLLAEAIRLVKRKVDSRLMLEPDMFIEHAYNLEDCFERLLKGQPFELKYKGQPYEPVAV